MENSVEYVFNLAKDVQADVDELYKPPQEGRKAKYSRVIDPVIVANARGYIKSRVNEVNGTYENGWYDACAIMLRRLMETLIFELYRSQNRIDELRRSEKIDDYHNLKELVRIVTSDKTLDLESETLSVMPKLRTVGNRFGHGRRLSARLSDIEPLRLHIRIMVQDLLEEAGQYSKI